MGRYKYDMTGSSRATHSRAWAVVRRCNTDEQLSKLIKELKKWKPTIKEDSEKCAIYNELEDQDVTSDTVLEKWEQSPLQGAPTYNGEKYENFKAYKKKMVAEIERKLSKLNNAEGVVANCDERQVRRKKNGLPVDPFYHQYSDSPDPAPASAPKSGEWDKDAAKTALTNLDDVLNTAPEGQADKEACLTKETFKKKVVDKVAAA